MILSVIQSYLTLKPGFYRGICPAASPHFLGTLCAAEVGVHLRLSSEGSFRSSLWEPAHVFRSRQLPARGFLERECSVLKDHMRNIQGVVVRQMPPHLLQQSAHSLTHSPFATSPLVGSCLSPQDRCASGPPEWCLLLTSITAQSGIQVKFKVARQHSPARPPPHAS